MKPRSDKVSRRDFARLVMTSGLAAGVAPAQAPSREAELRAAQQRRQSTAEALRKFDVPMATEPAFVFRP